jgi:hypothetical protein
MPGKTVTIYLRAIIKDKTNCLALFDTNRRGEINNLETVVEPGSKIVWELDWLSGIKNIVSIRSKETNPSILKLELKGMKPGEFTLQLPPGLNRALEAYIIEYILDDKDNTRVIIDPYIRIEPPDVKDPVVKPN